MKRRVHVPQYSIDEKKIGVPFALALKMMREINVGGMVNDAITWNDAHWKTTPGDLAEGVVLAAMSDLRPPLYHIKDRLADLDFRYLYTSNVTAADFNQYNIGEMLERLGRADSGRLYQKLALNALTIYNVAVSRLHADTTTIAFSGRYEAPEEGAVQIERGYNKDGRPLDKQVVVGQITTDSGIVIDQHIMNGSTSDVDWNATAIDHVKAIQAAFSTGDAPLIADSKLVCQKHIKTLLDGGIHFISRLPANYGRKLESRTIRRALENSEAFQDLGQVGTGKAASRYLSQCFVERIEGKPVRLLVLHSSSLQEKAEAAMVKERDELTVLAKKLEKKTFFCEADAREELMRFRQDRRLLRYEDTFQLVSEQKERWPRGRRKADALPESVETRYRWTFMALDAIPDKMARDLSEASCIVLIAYVNEHDSDLDILTAYKGQQAVENSFRVLKTPSVASVVYLENEHRIAGLLMLLHLSLLIRALIQYRMREGHDAFRKEHPHDDLRLGYSNKKTTSLTYAMFHEHCKGLYFILQPNGSFELRYNNREHVEKVLKYLEFMGLEPGDVLDMPC